MSDTTGTEARPAAGTVLEIDALQLGPIATNCYVVREQGSTRAFVVDPGADHERVLELAQERGLDIEAILVTHCHWDHIGGVAGLGAATGAPVWMSGAEAPALETPEQYRFPGTPEIPAWRVDHRLDGGERIEVAGVAIDVILTPGHSPGHVTFLVDGIRESGSPTDPDGADTTLASYASPPVAFDGDVIFRGSIGRTDLPFADPATMERTLRMLATRLHPDTVLLSGHTPPTTMGDELRTNPFLQGA